MKKRTLFVLAAILAIAILLTGCGAKETPTPEPIPVVETAAPEAAPAAKDDELNDAGFTKAQQAAIDEGIKTGIAAVEEEVPAQNDAETDLWELCTAAGLTGEVVADLVGHQGLVRLSTEKCTWGLSMSKTGETTKIQLPKKAVVTVHRPGQENAEVFAGSMKDIEVWGSSTIRFFEGFEHPEEETLEEWACKILQSENENGAKQVQPFVVEPGNIVCPSFTLPTLSAPKCPDFGGYELDSLDDGGCKLQWVDTRGVVTGTVPQGWKALWWNSEEQIEVWTLAGETVTIGEATLYQEN